MTQTTAPRAASTSLEQVRCALCNSDTPVPFQRKGGFEIVRCSACGLVYVNPRPARGELRSLYQDPSYFSGDEWYLDYLGNEPHHRKLFQSVVALLDRFCTKKGALVDVGCAAGFLLDTAREDGWEVTGVDLSPTMADHAKTALGLDVRVGTLEEATFPDASFDAVTLCDSLEHVANPLLTMREVNRILRPGATTLIITPNIASSMARLLRTWWPHLTPKEHIYYFAPDTVRELLSRAGFETVYQGSVGHYFTLEYIGRKLAPWAGAFWKLPLWRTTVNLNVGDIIVIARKSADQPLSTTRD
jgi:2-polyprenyl-3-methyl-5-hydroxy-6-metoxy-1,4-benzoquinol methylase